MILVITNQGLTKIATARSGGDKVSLTQFSVGFTLGTVDATNTSVPSQLYGLTPINSAFLADTNSAQFECIIPENIGPFDFNVLGLFDDTSTLIAIAKADSLITKIGTVLPNIIGTRVVLRAQLAITNANAVLNFTLNTLSNANLNFVSSVSSLSDLATSGIYKTYRVLAMPDGYSDVATSNGVNWSYGRYNSLFVGTSASNAADLTHIVGDATKVFKSYHVGGVVEFTGGANQGKVRTIASVNETTNTAEISSAVGSIPQSGTTFLVSVKDKAHNANTIQFSDVAGYVVDDTNLIYDSLNKRIGVRTTSPSSSYHQTGGGLRVQGLSTPSGPAVNPQGSLGTTTYTYYVVAKDYEGNRTLVSNSGLTNAGNSTLNGSNFNRITWSAIPGAKNYDILKSSTSTLLGTVTGTQLDDTGQATSAYTPPTRNETADILIDGKVTVGQDPVNPLDLVTKQFLDALVAIIVPTGSIKMWPSAAVPSGWLICDGSVVSRTTYATLFALIGTSFGAGNGTTTFNLPDFKGRSPIGLGISDAPNAITTFVAGGKYGEERHVQTLAELAPHSHTYTGPTGGNLAQGGANISFNGQSTSTVGSGTPSNIVHPVLGVAVIIKY